MPYHGDDLTLRNVQSSLNYYLSFMGVRYKRTIIQLGTTHTKFELRHYQAHEIDG